jgi:hypothetical protein
VQGKLDEVDRAIAGCVRSNYIKHAKVLVEPKVVTENVLTEGPFRG